MKWYFLYQITAASRTSWLGGYRPQILVLSVLCPQLNLLTPTPEQNSWVRYWVKNMVKQHGPKKWKWTTSVRSCKLKQYKLTSSRSTRQCPINLELKDERRWTSRPPDLCADSNLDMFRRTLRHLTRNCWVRTRLERDCLMRRTGLMGLQIYK